MPDNTTSLNKPREKTNQLKFRKVVTDYLDIYHVPYGMVDRLCIDAKITWIYNMCPTVW